MEKRVFLSHSQKDKPIADFICSALESSEVGCWIAPRDIPYGNDWAGEITNAIEQCDLFVFILSQYSNASRQCPKEISIADNVGVPIICIKTDDSEMNPGLKYHLSMQQMMVVDAAKLAEEINSVVATVKDKLFGIAEFQPAKKKNSPSENTYNVDEQLYAKFDELFGPSSVREEKCDNLETTSARGKLGDIVTKKFIQHFEDDVKEIERKKEQTEDKSTFTLRKLVLNPLNKEGEYIVGKHFNLPNTDGVKTLVFQVLEDVDYDTKSKYYDCVLLPSAGNSESGYSTYFVDNLPAEGTSLFFLHFYESGNKLLLNTGALYNNVVKVCKRPMLQTFQKISVKNNKIHLSNVGYDADSFSLSDFSDLHGSNDEVWHEADIRTAPIVVIDPETAELVLREVYYDQATATMKARMKLTNNKSYFAFQVRNRDTDSPSVPLTNLEQAQYFRLGLHGFPKGPLKAAELLENENTPEALFEMALLFAENDEFYDEETYCQYLQDAIEQHSENAIVEQALAVYFGEISNICLDQCIELLNGVITEESTVSAYVLAVILEGIDPARSFELYLSAANNDFLPAISRLQCLDSSALSHHEDALLDAFMKSLNDNMGIQEYCLGCATFFGYGMRARKSVGLKLLIKASDLGDFDAQKALFEIYDIDEQYEDKQKALFWLEKVVAFDFSEIVTLANRYIDGIGCEVSRENDMKAYNALSKLEDSDNCVAINNLAWMIKLGRGCERDYKKAKFLFECAAKKGCSSSIYHLGTMYEEGLGVEVDVEYAMELYTAASERGSKKAIERLEKINKK